MYVSVILVLTWGGQGARKSQNCTYAWVFQWFRCSTGEGREEGNHRIAHTYVRFCDFGAHMGRAGRKEITEMHIRMCASVIAVLTWGGQGGRKSQKCTYVCIFLWFRCSHDEGREEGTHRTGHMKRFFVLVQKKTIGAKEKVLHGTRSPPHSPCCWKSSR